MNATGIVRTWAERWRNLRSWPTPLDAVAITISERMFASRNGTCWPFERRLVVYQQPRLTDMLATVLHELAHAATIGEHHGERWQAALAAAATEVTGIQIPAGVDGAFEVINAAVKDAVRYWWRHSGNELAAKLLLRNTTT